MVFYSGLYSPYVLWQAKRKSYFCGDSIRLKMFDSCMQENHNVYTPDIHVLWSIFYLLIKVTYLWSWAFVHDILNIHCLGMRPQSFGIKALALLLLLWWWACIKTIRRSFFQENIELDKQWLRGKWRPKMIWMKGAKNDMSYSAGTYIIGWEWMEKDGYL